MFNLTNFKRCIRCGFLTVTLLIIVSCGGEDISEQQMLENARAHIGNGKVRAAAIELRNVLQENSSNAEARFLLGSIGLEIGYLTSAEKEFRRAALAGWDEEQTQLALARVLMARKKYQDLLDDIKIKPEWSPTTSANITALRALAEASLYQYPKAKTTLEESKSYNADAFEVLNTTIQLQLAGILDDDVSNTLARALSLYPDNSELLLLHAINDLHNENITAASKTFQKIIDHDSADFITRDGRNARIGLARIQITDKQYTNASNTLAPLLKANNRDPVANYLSSLLAFSLEDYGKAELYMRKLLKLVPEHNQSQQLMGNIKFELHDYAQAAHHLTASLAETPDNLLIYKLLTKTYLKLNKPTQAKLIINKAFAIDPNDPEVLSLLSQLSFNQGDKTAGINTLIRAIKINPENAILQKQLAIAYISAHELEKAHLEIKTFGRLSKDIEETQKLYIRAYVQAGNINKAIEIANELLINNPQSPEIISLNGNLYAADSKPQQAREYFNKALEINNGFTAARLGIARLEKSAGNFDNAAKLYEGLVEENDEDITSMLALSDIARLQGRTNDMLGWLEKAREASPSDIKSRAILANHYLQNSQVKNANKYILEAIKIAPNQAELLSLHGKILIAQKQYGEALQPLKKLVGITPDSTDARTLLGKTFLHMRMTETARSHLQIALNNQENNALVLSLLAETELQAKNFDESLKYAKRLQEARPEHYAGYMQEGQVWLEQQNYHNALSAFKKAWQRQQTAEMAQLLFSAALPIEGFEQAAIPLLSWIQDNPDDTVTHLFLAFRYLSAERNEDAIREYEKILEKAPKDTALLNNLAWLYSLEGNPKALDFAERAFRLSPEDTGVLDTYGWILTQRNQAEKGKRLLYLAMQKSPDNLEIQYHYATALIQSGDQDKGALILEKLLDVDTPFAGRHDAKALLREIKPGS